MISWLEHPHAPYVLAAYGVAAVLLVGLLVVSLRARAKLTPKTDDTEHP